MGRDWEGPALRSGVCGGGKSCHHGRICGPKTLNHKKHPTQTPKSAQPKGTRRLPRGCKRMATITRASAAGPMRYGKSHGGKPKAAESKASSFGCGWAGEVTKQRSQRIAQRAKKVASQSARVAAACNRPRRRCHSQKNPPIVISAVTAGPPAMTHNRERDDAGGGELTLVSA